MPTISNLDVADLPVVDDSSDNHDRGNRREQARHGDDGRRQSHGVLKVGDHPRWRHHGRELAQIYAWWKGCCHGDGRVRVYEDKVKRR